MQISVWNRPRKVLGRQAKGEQLKLNPIVLESAQLCILFWREALDGGRWLRSWRGHRCHLPWATVQAIIRLTGPFFGPPDQSLSKVLAATVWVIQYIEQSHEGFDFHLLLNSLSSYWICWWVPNAATWLLIQSFNSMKHEFKYMLHASFMFHEFKFTYEFNRGVPRWNSWVGSPFFIYIFPCFLPIPGHINPRYAGSQNNTGQPRRDSEKVQKSLRPRRYRRDVSDYDEWTPQKKELSPLSPRGVEGALSNCEGYTHLESCITLFPRQEGQNT